LKTAIELAGIARRKGSIKPGSPTRSYDETWVSALDEIARVLAGNGLTALRVAARLLAAIAATQAAPSAFASPAFA